ncbi:hypothetical protein LIA77_08441 [Sarocladium implicatum]|nr:hypothetical protein LIA77_08441 [Sarocladium implicatum]
MVSYERQRQRQRLAARTPDPGSDIPDDGFQLPPPAYTYESGEVMHIDFRESLGTIPQPPRRVVNGEYILHMARRRSIVASSPGASGASGFSDARAFDGISGVSGAAGISGITTASGASYWQARELTPESIASDSHSLPTSLPSYPESEEESEEESDEPRTPTTPPPSWHMAEAQALVTMHTYPYTATRDSEAYTRWLARRRNDTPLLARSWEAHSQRLEAAARTAAEPVTRPVTAARRDLDQAAFLRREDERFLVRMWQGMSAHDKAIIMLLLILLVSGFYTVISTIVKFSQENRDEGLG